MRAVTHLAQLEAEAIYVMREAAAQLDAGALLFSGGKDSSVLLRIAERAFRPAPFPFPVVHIDTGHNFPEVIAFRDSTIAALGEELVVRCVQETIDKGIVREESGPRASRNRLQSATLLECIHELGLQFLLTGARRDEEKARAKERFFSLRNEHGQWDPRTQRAEVWNLLNGRIHKEEHLRVFPLSNWSEIDVWEYIERDAIDVPSIYFAHRREVFERDGMWLSVSSYLQRTVGEASFVESVRFRTVGDMTCSAAVRSNALTVRDVINENLVSEVSERGASRADDTISETSMEDRKREGYF